nr:hypothetical protein [Nonlabens ulvanivorans]
MKITISTLLFFITFLCYGQVQQIENNDISSTENDSIINVISEYQFIDEENYPDAIIYAKSDAQQVYVVHQGIKMWCDQVFL